MENKEENNLRDSWTPKDEKLFKMLLNLGKFPKYGDSFDPITICKYIEDKFSTHTASLVSQIESEKLLTGGHFAQNTESFNKALDVALSIIKKEE